ncbi:hypothetical protein H5410_056239 [Solanum commersonii]|uniref:Uncharacterized protein n=1 Tax=Solanum commersonii TaxID=4109 RepID=A0A9J5WJQ4_SOLCO|nr:hypothetical protein H5410_056239 [Solanum commersonii]
MLRDPSLREYATLRESSKITFCAALNFSRKLFTSSMQTSQISPDKGIRSRLPVVTDNEELKTRDPGRRTRKGISTANKLTLSRVESLLQHRHARWFKTSTQPPRMGENIFASTISIKRSLTHGKLRDQRNPTNRGATRPTNSYMNIVEVLLYGGGVGAFVIALDNVRGVVGAFVIALDDVQEKKFQSTSDHVESANDFAMNCEETFASRNVQDDGISKGDNLVMYFSLPAGVVINVLNGETTMYTTF